jgi:DNA mismatch repair protein MutH
VSAPPTSEADLLVRAHALSGVTLAELAATLGQAQPGLPRHTKGWIGTLLENALGADAGSRPLPDFTKLNIELKTIPVTTSGVPRESTFVCMAPADVRPGERWESSLVHRKTRRVLWLPIETSPTQPVAARRIGWGVLWSPTAAQDAILKADWEELIELVATGRRDTITARLGEYLQIRPKAADRRATTTAADTNGNPTRTLPRGFYLRASFTREVLTSGLS